MADTGVARYADGNPGGYSDDEVEYLAADFIEVTTLAVEEPVITGVEEGPRGTGTVTGLSRMAEVAAPRLGEAAAPRLAEAELPRLAQAEAPRLGEAAAPRLAEAPRLADAEAPRLADAEAPRLAEAEAPRLAEAELPRPAETEVYGLAGAKADMRGGRSRAAAAKARKAARRKGRTRRRVVVAGVCVPAVAAAAAIAVMNQPGKHTPAASGGSPSTAAPSSSASQSMGPWQHIGTRAGDPTPLTLGQLFPATFSSDGSYVRTAEAGSSDCAKAVFGSALQAAVHKHGCSQVMRASYLSTAKHVMGTIGVLNLTNSNAASAVGRVTGSSEFIAQLTAAKGPTHNLTKGTGLEEAEVKGHYLILTWVEFTNLHPPSTSAEKAQLKTFSADLINRTANVSLTSRMVTGNPQMP